LSCVVTQVGSSSSGRYIVSQNRGTLNGSFCMTS
jgi:hypothetical protein